MQCKQMAESLQQLVPLLEHDSAAILTQLADAVRPEGTKSFGAVAAKLEKRLKTLQLEVRTSPASALLDRMAEVAKAAGAETLRKDFSTGSQLIALLGSLESDHVSATLGTAMTPAPTKTKAPKAPLLDVGQAKDKLAAVSGDTARFESFLAELSKYPKDALGQIAQEYLGHARQFKSKPEIIKAIRSRQLQDALDESREDRASKLPV